MMKLRIAVALLSGFALLLAGCHGRSDTLNLIDVSGTWRGSITVTSCEPADACITAGLPQGKSLTTTVILTQDRQVIDGTYAYEDPVVNAPVEGRVGGNQITMNGVVQSNGKSTTVNADGTVSGNVMTLTVTHQFTLSSGNAANVTGSGSLTR